MKKRTSIIESHAFFRSLLEDMVRSIEGYSLEQIIRDPDAWPILLTDPPDILLIDLEVSKSGLCPCEVVSRLSQEYGTSCIVMSFSTDADLVHMAFEKGAVGYLLKDSEYDEFRANLELALTGGIPISARVSRLIVNSFGRTADAPAQHADGRTAFVAEVDEAVEDYLGNPMETCCSNLSDYLSLKFHLSYGHISTLYKEQSGITLRQHRMMRRIEPVKHMLRNTDHTLTQIADMLEFSSVAHLSSCFHRITGSTPTEFRKAGTGGVHTSLKDAKGRHRA